MCVILFKLHSNSANCRYILGGKTIIYQVNESSSFIWILCQKYWCFTSFILI